MRVTGSQNVGSGRSKKAETGADLLREQKKLEEMVGEMLAKGDRNLGENTKILKQSGKLDKLIVDEMMLREMKKKYPKKD